MVMWEREALKISMTSGLEGAGLGKPEEADALETKGRENFTDSAVKCCPKAG